MQVELFCACVTASVDKNTQRVAVKVSITAEELVTDFTATFTQAVTRTCLAP
jgi:hypothetical protein